MFRLTCLLVLAVPSFCGVTPGPRTTEVEATPEPTVEWVSHISSSEAPKTTSTISSTIETPKGSQPISMTSITPKSSILISSYSDTPKVTTETFSTPDSTEASILNSEEISDLGEPLFLTPLIEAGNVSEAQRLARVPFTDHLNITSYSGFYTVNKTYNSNQFFWYFPPTKAVSKTAPVILWLQGGPGGSSLYGLLKENGPIFYTEEKGFQIREYHWAIDHHMIYIDNPVGTGFSFTEDDSGYCTNEVEIGEHLYSSVVQFLKLFPDLQQNEFYLTGESYAGKYIPALGYTIHKKNQEAELKINLKGMAIGNGLCDPEHQIGYSEHAYQAGLIDWHDKEEGTRMENDAVRFIKQKHFRDAFFMYYNARYFGTTGLSHFNYVFNKASSFLAANCTPISDSVFRRDIHVGNRTFASNKNMVREKLMIDRMQSVAPWISELLSHYRILFYNGQFDLVIPYPVTINFLKNLQFSSAKEYETAKRRQWKVDGEIAGYYKEAGNLTEVLVRNSGHMVPADQPKWALRLIQMFTRRPGQIIPPIPNENTE